MALNGTIKDFGVADILQLVSHQAKTGSLLFKNDIDSVKVYFREGAIVNAESATMTPDRMLGTRLVRAEVITQGQLDQALTEQLRTLQRLRQVLLDLKYVGPTVLNEFATLQMSETVYQLFEWTDGTYQFDAEDVPPADDGVEPIRVDTFVFNGARIVDEWPAIRERIPSYRWIVERTRDLPAPRPDAVAAMEWDASVIDEGDRPPEPDLQERRVYDLIGTGRTVQKIIDLSRLGEFETCQALSNLMQNGFVRVIAPPTDDEPDFTREAGLWTGLPSSVRQAGRMLISASMVILTAFLLASTSRNLSGRGEQDLVYRPDPVADRFARTQIKVIRRALEVYRFQTGSYPLSLEELVEGGFVRKTEVRYPFTMPYFYRVNEAGEVVLLPPVR